MACAVFLFNFIQMEPLLIIGAGAAGLMAAHELSGAGLSVTILEAAGQAGGRILTQERGDFSIPVEAGAEFVHGSLPLTLGLLKEGGIAYRPVKGKMIRVRKGEWIKEDRFSGDWGKLMVQMGQLQKDMPIEAFLDTYFSGPRYDLLRSGVRGMAEGYDLVDPVRASTLALYKEWQEEGGHQYRVDGGYSRMIHYLRDQCLSRGCTIHYQRPVRSVTWQKGRVTLQCAAGETFIGSRLITTVSLGILQLAPGQPSALVFSPDIPAYRQAALEMGYGSVIKVLMEFKTLFWEKKGKNIGFVLSDEAVPTWWTQYPAEKPLLTAWLAASAMRNFQALDEEGRMDACVGSLASIFQVEPGVVREQLVAYTVYDWMKAPYVHGGYSYETVGSEAARKRMHQEVEGTLYFSGEALYEGQALATVEAALQSGKDVAEKLIARSGPRY